MSIQGSISVIILFPVDSIFYCRCDTLRRVRYNSVLAAAVVASANSLL
jgi:hypothetical protein